MTTLRVAVVMITCDGGEYVDAQLRSIAAQSRPPDLLLISDDASTDGTAETVAAFAAAAPFPVTTILRDERVGLQHNAEAAMRRALPHADVMVLADQDDLWHPGKLARIAGAFESDERMTVWFSDAALIGPDDHPLGRRLWQMMRIDPEWIQAVSSGGGLDRLVHGQTLTGAVMAVRTRLVELALPLPRDRREGEVLFHHDGWLAVLGRLSGRIAGDADPLTSYRRHPRQVTAAEPIDRSEEYRAPRGVRRSGRAQQLIRERDRVDLIAERVRARPEQSWDPALRAELLALDGFLATRAEVALGRGRLRAVLAQVRCGGYRRFAGLPTVLVDLARWARRGAA